MHQTTSFERNVSDVVQARGGTISLLLGECESGGGEPVPVETPGAWAPGTGTSGFSPGIKLRVLLCGCMSLNVWNV